MKYIRLYLRMLRYRSALVLVLFMLLGAAWNGNLSSAIFRLIIISAALVSTYVCATCINDLADFEIDKINLKNHDDRPLVAGTASKADLIAVAVAASIISLSLGFLVGPTIAFLVGAILLMNLLYSLPPLLISHRAILTPFYLVVGYIVMPYWIGTLIIGGRLGPHDAVFLPALYLLFLARISLKDFRDREGDAKNNKPTLILKYGKRAVCGLSIGSLILGSVLLLWAVKSTPWLIFGLGIYVLSLVVTELRLLRTNDRLRELLSIGFGARIGNGMLFVLLGVLIMQRAGAPTEAQILFYTSITLLYGSLFSEFWRNPDDFQFGNKAVTAHHHGLPKSR